MMQNNNISNHQDQENYALQCENVFFHYGTSPTLNNINLNIPRGAVVGIIGSNGSGKSTLLQCMVGLLEVDQGSVSILGCDAMQIGDNERERLGYVAQSPDLFNWMSVEQHLSTIGRAYPKWTEQHAIELAIKLQLPLGRSVSKLSGGDQQKLAVVLALAHSPELIVMDEPVSSLDPIIRREFMRSLFADYSEFKQQENIPNTPTIIISSHILSDLERVITHAVFMREGCVICFETWDNILENYRLLKKENSLETVPPAAIVHQSNTHYVLDCRHLEMVQLSHQNQVFSSLDDVFVALST